MSRTTYGPGSMRGRSRDSYRSIRGGPGPRLVTAEKCADVLQWPNDINDEAIKYDQKSDGMYPLLSNDRSPDAGADPGSPQSVSRRSKGVSRTCAPVFLKNERRIQALFFLYFMAL